MPNKQLENKIINVIEDTLSMIQLDIEVRLDTCGINMNYHFINNTIGYDPVRIVAAKKEIGFPITLTEYVQTFTLHEVGHALDREALLASLEDTVAVMKLHKKYPSYQLKTDPNLLKQIVKEDERNISYEKTAWNNARKLNKEYNVVNVDLFNKIETHSLQTYIDMYKESLVLYNSAKKRAVG